jgi:hypothetical protein
MLILRNRPESIGYIDFLIENATQEELSAPELDRAPLRDRIAGRCATPLAKEKEPDGLDVELQDSPK